MFSSRSLQSAAALLVYACQRVGRASGLNLSCFAPFHFHGAGGSVFRQISTIGGGAFSTLCMPAGPEGQLGERLFSLPLLNFPGAVEGRVSEFRWIATLGGYMPARLEGMRAEPCFCFSPAVKF